jgi:hypothetical protein
VNTYLIGSDNSITHTIRSPIIEKSNLVDSIQFICDKTHNGYDMSEFDVLMEYKLPISKTHRIVKLVLSDSNYKNDYLAYSLPSGKLTTAITQEVGEVEMAVSFVKAEMDYDGVTSEYVRNLGNTATLKILPLSSWFHASDEALSDITAMYLENKKTALALSEIANQLNMNMVDGIKLTDDSLDLTVNGVAIGNGVSLNELNEKLVEEGSNTTGNIKIINIS